MTGLALAVLLLAVAAALVTLELFVPSGGVISILAIAATVASVVVVYTNESPTVGTLYLLALCIFVPIVIGAAIRYWPNSPLGRRILNLPPEGVDGSLSEMSHNTLTELVGKTGIARSKMLPSGAIVIDGRTYDAVGDGMAIEPGEAIEVVEVKANRIVVRPLRDATNGAADNGDSLSRPVDEVIADPFEDPLA